MTPIAQHQQQLNYYIQALCQKYDNRLPFSDFMHAALYAPGLGYYSAGMTKFGAAGDFVTAPEISPLFSRTLGAQCLEILSRLQGGAILELGAGTGAMASEILNFLGENALLPEKYFILEVSADLQSRQRDYLQTHCAHNDRVQWLQALPSTSFRGIILGNEVIDAMPVSLFMLQENTILEGMVSNTHNGWVLDYHTPITPTFLAHMQTLLQDLPEPLTPGYTSEILLTLTPWLASLSDCLAQGVMLFIDYGFPRKEYYHPSRTMGTLMCHHRHRAHSNPLLHVGLQDITAHVDFTQVAHSAVQCGLTIGGYAAQAAFLINNGLLDFATAVKAGSLADTLSLSQQIQHLLQPHEMGELCKVIALCKDYADPLQGFIQGDQLHRL